MGGAEKLAKARKKLLRKVFSIAASRDMEAEIEFDDQEIMLGDDAVVLNGTTTIRGGKKDA